MPLVDHHSITTVARAFGRKPRTIRDWITKGCPTPGGLVRLPADKLGRRWSVSDEDLALFRHRVRPQDGRPELDAGEDEGDDTR